MAAVCLRACRHSEDINHTDGLTFNGFSGHTDQVARFDLPSQLANEENCTFTVISGSQIMDITHGAKA
jgi:hypothetical protein